MSAAARVRLAVGLLVLCAVLNVRFGFQFAARILDGSRPEERLAIGLEQLRSRLPVHGVIEYVSLPGAAPSESVFAEISARERLTLARRVLAPLVVVSGTTRSGGTVWRVRETLDSEELWVIESAEAQLAAMHPFGGGTW